MIKVKHPIDQCNRNQEEILAMCPPNDRRFHELIFTHGNILYRYHLRADDFTPTMEDWKEWLESLPINIKKDLTSKGFEYCKKILPFTKYILEKNDIGIDEYVRQNMDPEDYAEYKQPLKNN